MHMLLNSNRTVYNIMVFYSQSAVTSEPNPSQTQSKADRLVVNEQDSFDEEGLGTCVALYEFQGGYIFN